MTPFYLKTKAKSIVGFLALLIAFFGLQAFIGNPNDNFMEDCKKADAYLVHYFTDVTYVETWTGYKRYTSISSKMVINNNVGVDRYAYLNLPESKSNKIDKIDVKTLKADGSVIELDSSLVFKKELKNSRFGDINYPIPGVEPGDTIETNYTYIEILRPYEMKEFVNLTAEVPSLQTEYTVRANPKLTIRYKQYNQFPEAQVIANDSMIYCGFKMEKVKGYQLNDYSCLPCELPYMYYAIDEEKGEASSWKEIYNEEFNLFSQPLALDTQNIGFYNRWKKRVLEEAKDSSKYHQFKVLHKFIYDNFEIEDVERKEFIKSNGYFLKQNRFDPISIRRMYRRMLEDLEIDYYAVFGRSKRSGMIDPEFIRKGEFDHVFFAYRDDTNTVNLLYPHDTEYKYRLNEIPTSLYNTEAVLAQPVLSEKEKRKGRYIDRDLEMAIADSVQISLIQLPGSVSQHNTINQLVYTKVDLENKKTPLKYRSTVSGGLFTEIQGFFRMLADNEEMSNYYDAMSEVEGEEEFIEIDSVTNFVFKEGKPFGYTMTATGKLNGAVTFLNDGMLSISLAKLLDHNIIASEQDKTDLNYYLDYGFSDHFMAIFSFPKDIEILGLEDYDKHLENDVGEYSFNLKHFNGNELTLQSNYKIHDDLIPKTKLAQLKALNELAKELQNKHIIVKVK